MPHFFSFSSARNYIKGKLDFFTSLYEFMDHSVKPLRWAATNMFCKIVQKLSKGAYAFNLITKAATNQALKSRKAPFDDLILSLSMTDLP